MNLLPAFIVTGVIALLAVIAMVAARRVCIAVGRCGCHCALRLPAVVPGVRRGKTQPRISPSRKPTRNDVAAHCPCCTRYGGWDSERAAIQPAYPFSRR